MNSDVVVRGLIAKALILLLIGGLVFFVSLRASSLSPIAGLQKPSVLCCGCRWCLARWRSHKLLNEAVEDAVGRIYQVFDRIGCTNSCHCECDYHQNNERLCQRHFGMHWNCCELQTFIADSNVISPERLECTSTLVFCLKKKYKTRRPVSNFSTFVCLYLKSFPFSLNFHILHLSRCFHVHLGRG